ncbi:MAG: TonB-dependent receptor [Desulfobacterales bacterium]|nr:TonB-dependent receptor [Desulfobacterales bacterium]
MRSLKKSFTVLSLIAFVLFLNGPRPGFGEEVKRVDEMFDMSLEELLDVKVSIATKFPMASEEAPAIVSVVTAEEIRNMGARNIIDILRTVPGFDLTHLIQRANHQGTVRAVSTGTLDNTLVLLVNGHTFGAGTYSGGPGFFFDVIPIDNIRKIEIIRGPGSALYGTDAFNGVINIITREGGDAPSRISAEAGSFNTQKYVGEFSHAKDDFKMYLYGDYYTTDGPAEIIESDFATIQFGPRGSATPDRTTEKSKHYTFFTDMDYKNFYFNGFLQQLDTEIPVGPIKALTDEDDIDLFYTYVDLGVSLPITNQGNLDVRIYYDYSDEIYFQEIWPEETGALMGFPDGESHFGKPSRKNSNLGAEITADYDMGSGVKLVAGALYERVKLFDVKSIANFNITGAPLEIDGTIYAPNEYFGEMLDMSENGNYAKDASRDIAAVYGQATADMKSLLSLDRGVESLSVTVGARYDHYSDIDSSVTPRFGIVYAPTKKLYFKALYGQGFDAPEFAQLYTKNNPVGLGNPGLQPEKITTIEGLIGYNFTNNIKTSATFFHNEAEDLSKFLWGRAENVGKMESRGVELELRAGMDQLKYMYINTTWQEVQNTTRQTIISAGGQEYTQDDFFPGGAPSFIGNIGVNYDVFDWMIANVSLNYTGERKKSEGKMWAGETLVDIDDRDPTPDRLLLNATLTFRNFYKGLEARISGYNLLDEDHRDHDPDGRLENEMPRPGASFMCSLSYTF